MTYEDTLQEKADALAEAIAVAEGFFVKHSLPAVIHNPGDLELGDRGFGTQSGKTVYQKADPAADLKDGSDGWSALRQQCLRMLSGASFVYSVGDSFAVVAQKWTGGDNAPQWAECVCSKLGIDPSWTIRDYVFGKAISA